MSKKLDSFLDSVCIHVKCKTVYKDIRDELTSHIDDIIGILVNLNLFPLLSTGILFLSYGGTGYVASMSPCWYHFIGMAKE